MTRAQLDGAMRRVLGRLEVCSHVPAGGWGPTGTSPSSDEPQGGKRPPGDYGHTVFAREYGPPFHADRGARNDGERARILERAQEELKHLRGQAEVRTLAPLESPEQTIVSMLKETEGWAPEDVEKSRWRMSARVVRRHRVTHGRTAEKGKVEFAPESATVAALAQQHHENGLSLRQIAMILGKDQKQIQRYLGRAA